MPFYAYAVDLAHYISDLHVPLHTSGNYDGKQTAQNGIHALWETQLPEAFMANYNLFPTGPQALWVESPMTLFGNPCWKAMPASIPCSRSNNKHAHPSKANASMPMSSGDASGN